MIAFGLSFQFLFIFFILANFASFSLTTSQKTNQPSNTRTHPVILVPGDGGSQLEAKLDKPEVVHYFCSSKTNDYFTLWINLEEIVPYAIDCFADNMRLVYNNITRKTSNSPGVDIRVPDFGSTQSVEFLDPSRYSLTGYFNILVEGLLKLGYIRNETIRGAPYDFRKSPRELNGYLDKFTKLVEETYTMTNDNPVVIVCHSMGCLLMVHYFSQQKQTWKDKHIKSLITLGAPWGGAVKAMKAFATGDNIGVIVIPELKIRKDERTYPSMAFLLPRPSFWPENQTLVKHGEKNYSISNYKSFFHDLDFDTGYEMWLDTKDLISDLPAPGVEVHCLYGSGIDTMDYLEYEEGKFPDHNPKIKFGDGDGTVNLRSLEGCLRWKNDKKTKLFSKKFKGVDHLSVMSQLDVVNYIENIVAPHSDQQLSVDYLQSLITQRKQAFHSAMKATGQHRPKLVEIN